MATDTGSRWGRLAAWSAEFVAPDPLPVFLGTSGTSVDIEIREDRSFWLAGSELRSGREVLAQNGNRYTLLVRR